MSWKNFLNLLQRPSSAPLARGSDETAAQCLDVPAEQLALSESVLQTAVRLMAQDSTDTAAIVTAYCESLTRFAPRIKLAWVWFGDRDTQAIRPQYMAGAARAYAESLVIERSFLTRLGPAFRSLNGIGPQEYEVSARSSFGPWREMARQHATRSVLAPPLGSTEPGKCGLAVFYADTENYFSQTGIRLFEALAQLFSMTLSKAARIEGLEREALVDALTGLGNRRAVDLAVRRSDTAAASALPGIVLLADLDHFKRINDTHGHPAGDAVLREAAARLRACVRGSDLVARWGGEEFLLLLRGARPDDARRIAEKVCQAFRDRPVQPEGVRPLKLTVSIGLAAWRPEADFDAALARADAALYAAKQGGRDGWRLADD